MTKRFLILGLLLLLLPALVLAQGQCQPTDPNSAYLCNPFAGKSINDLPQLLLYLLTIFTSFSTLIPVIMVMAAGFQMLIAQGNAEDIKRAKIAFSYAIYGFVAAVLSFVILAGMVNFLGATLIPDPSNPASSSVVINPINEVGFLQFILNRLVKGFLEVAGLLAILMLIFNGFRYITAGGDEEQIAEAKGALKWISSGLIAILFSYVIIRATANLFGLS